MRTKLNVTVGALMAMACLYVVGANGGESVSPPTKESDWSVKNGRISVKDYKGRKAFHLQSSKTLTLASLRDVTFANGTIEVEVAAPRKGDHYIGVAFRIQDKLEKDLKVRDNDLQQYEYIYFRPFKSGTGNAIQYCAAGTKYNWSYLRKNHPGVYEAKADLPETDWFHVRIVVSGANAAVYVNHAKKPNLVVKGLKHGLSKGSVGLYTYHKDAYFANFSVRPGEPIKRNGP